MLIESDREPPPHLLDALQLDKPEIMALLRTSDTDEVPLSLTITESSDLHGLTLDELEEAAGDVMTQPYSKPWPTP